MKRKCQCGCKRDLYGANQQRYATDTCRTRAYRKRRRGRIGSRPCDQCGEPYIIDPPGKRYCCERCAKAHSNAQQAAKRAANAQQQAMSPAASLPVKTGSPRPPTAEELKAKPWWAGCLIVNGAPTIGEDRAKADFEAAKRAQTGRSSGGWDPNDYDWRR